MTTDTLRMIYYVLFHSIILYGIIAWGGVYSSKNLLIKLQIILLKIIKNNKFAIDKNPMSIDQIFTYESLSYHYEDLQTTYVNSNSNTRKNSIHIPRRHLTVSIKNSYIRAITQFNNLPNELKTIRNKSSRKLKLKQWVRETTWYSKKKLLIFIRKETNYPE